MDKELKQLKSIVYAELIENPQACKNDTALIIGVFKRLGINTAESYESLAKRGLLRQVENGSITRCRRKILEENPEMRDKKLQVLEMKNNKTLLISQECQECKENTNESY